MKNIKLLFIMCILSLLLVCTFVSAARLPIVGGDDDSWGTVLNEFLNESLGENGTLRNDTVSTSQIIDGTITGADISNTTNLTLGKRIVFSLGGVIDNIINGWLRITGSLNVTGNVSADYFIGDGSQLTGIANINQSFGEIVGFTVASYDGNITNGSLIGYSAANAICNAEYLGSHFCLKSEVLKTIANGNYSFTGTAWFANGPPGYTANADDCSGWVTNSNIYLGPFWNWDANAQAGRGALTNCAQTKQLMCCGGDN